MLHMLEDPHIRPCSSGTPDHLLIAVGFTGLFSFVDNFFPLFLSFCYLCISFLSLGQIVWVISTEQKKCLLWLIIVAYFCVSLGPHGMSWWEHVGKEALYPMMNRNQKTKMCQDVNNPFKDKPQYPNIFSLDPTLYYIVIPMVAKADN